ncbi:MAG: hypothetical protein JWN00_915 [Actinomycetia bacterium]|nr:hypothetical protein [Actinomycetes bacterium]
MKHRDLIRKLRELAKAHDVEVVSDGGGDHEKWLVGSIRVMVPRHREIAEVLARAILKDVAKVLAAQKEEQ